MLYIIVSPALWIAALAIAGGLIPSPAKAAPNCTVENVLPANRPDCLEQDRLIQECAFEQLHATIGNPHLYLS